MQSTNMQVKMCQTFKSKRAEELNEKRKEEEMNNKEKLTELVKQYENGRIKDYSVSYVYLEQAEEEKSQVIIVLIDDVNNYTWKEVETGIEMNHEEIKEWEEETLYAVM